MKQLFYISIIFSLFFGLITGCSSVENNDSKIIDAYSCTLDIDGMMCEKGCKTTIQSKLSQMDGVIKVAVDYETAKAFVTYNHNEIQPSAMISMIGELAQGIYSADLVENAKVDLDPAENASDNVGDSKSVRSFSFDIPDITRWIPRLF